MCGGGGEVGLFMGDIMVDFSTLLFLILSKWIDWELLTCPPPPACPGCGSTSSQSCAWPATSPTGTAPTSTTPGRIS